MRILIVHNEYQQKGGEDAVVANERALLSGAGQEVELFQVSNHAIRGLSAKIRTAAEVSYSPSSRERLASELRRFRPDLIHVHNFFPLLTPSIYDACTEAQMPVVQTLHNYRTICAGALLMRNGRPCEDCITGSPYQGAIHGCYRESRIGSLPVARMIATHRRQGTWNSQVGRFIALSDFAKSRFVRAGFEAERIVVKPNFVSDPGVAERSSGPRRAVYVGRLSPEKGIRTLVRAWRELDLELRVIGDGPLESELRASAPSQVTFLGRLAPEEVLGEMRGASFLVVPSECYENFPLVIAEAYAAGLPVLASNLGSVAEVVEPGVHGERFVPGDADDLAAAARRLTAGQADLAKFARNCRRTYEEKYSPETNLRKLLTIYESLVNLPAQP